MLLERENSAFRFVNSILTEITSPQEIQAVEDALKNPLKPLIEHISTALQSLSDKKTPDFRNSIKESISAVEAACVLITGEKKATLGQAVKKIPHIHAALANAFSAMYGYTCETDGIRHALLEEQQLSYDDAKFMLVACSAFVNYLVLKTGADKR